MNLIVAGGRPPETRRTRFGAIAARLGPFARPYRRALASALIASVFLTAVQLAFPWPLTWMVERARVGPEDAGGTPLLLPAGVSPVVWLASMFALLGVAFGLAEYWQRVAVSRFIVPSVNDARLGLFSQLIDESIGDVPKRDPGDVVTRVVTDSARLRGGLKGVMVHLLQHGLFVLGVCVVLIMVDARIGLWYLLGLVLALAVALIGADLTASAARRRREAESRQVGSVLRAVRSGQEVLAKDPSRDRSDALITLIKGRTAWAVQGVLAATACAVLIVAVRLAESGEVETGDVALVASYLLMLHYPMMRIGRQITRLGPQLTSAERLARVAAVREHRAEAP